MVESMFGESFKDNVSAINSSEGVTTKLLTEVLLNGLGPEAAQNKVLGQVSDNITSDLILAIQYKDLVNESTEEVERTLDALEGQYIHPGMYGDLVDHPDLLPTGKNLYSFDGRLIPTKEAWAIGIEMGEQQLQLHRNKHNDSYPRKIGVVLWKSETCRLHGVIESEILYFLGVEPVWDGHDRWKDVKLNTSLDRPRIDVVMTTSGSYRDMFGYKFELLEKAVRLAANANDTEYPNYVKENSDSLYQWLRDSGYNDTEARSLSTVRIFTSDIGRFGTGLHEAIPATNMWDSEDEVADVYINVMGYMYGVDVWGVHSIAIFEHNLDGIEIGIFSCSSEVAGVLDQGVDSYLGGLALAVRSVSGETPDLYITNLRDQDNPTVETLSHFFNRELMTRYFNPTWIEGMMEHGYTGAKNMDEFLGRFQRWGVEVPDLVTDAMRREAYDIYVNNKYPELGMKEYFDSNNPHAYQSMTAHMLDAIRTGYWTPSDPDVVKTLVTEYVESVIKHGELTCCHHTCGNLDLADDYMSGLISAYMTPEDYERYHEILSATTEPTEQDVTPPPQSTLPEEQSDSSSNRGGTYPPGWFNETKETTQPAKSSFNLNETTKEGGIGKDVTKPANPSEASNPSEDYVEGSEMTVEKSEKFNTGLSFSGAPMLGMVLVIALMVIIYWGYRRRR